MPPLEIQVFSPFRIKSFPSRTAVIVELATSEPDCGSVSAKAEIALPERVSGSHSAFCASVPNREIAPVPNTHYVHQAGLNFVCGIAPGLAALGEGLDSAGAARWPDGEVAAARAGLAQAFGAPTGWGPGAAIAALQAAVPEDVVVTADTGAHRILLSQMWQCQAPRTMLQSTGLCTMGCALPLAAGYKLARPERPVLAVTGDAGLEMVLGELATLRDLALPVVIAVFVDASLALIELKQRMTGRHNLGVDFGGTDFAALARAMGGEGRVAADADSLKAEMRDAFARESFTLIAIPIGRKAYDGTF